MEIIIHRFYSSFFFFLLLLLLLHNWTLCMSVQVCVCFCSDIMHISAGKVSQDCHRWHQYWNVPVHSSHSADFVPTACLTRLNETSILSYRSCDLKGTVIPWRAGQRSLNVWIKRWRVLVSVRTFLHVFRTSVFRRSPTFTSVHTTIF